MKIFILYEIGSSCRTEFMMKDGSFHFTEDAVVIGIAKGENTQDAFENLIKESPYLKNYKFDRLVARETGRAVYLRAVLESLVFFSYFKHSIAEALKTSSEGIFFVLNPMALHPYGKFLSHVI